MTSNVAKCLLISKVLVADGMMSDDERTFLDELMTKLGLDADEKNSVVELEGPDCYPAFALNGTAAPTLDTTFPSSHLLRRRFPRARQVDLAPPTVVARKPA